MPRFVSYSCACFLFEASHLANTWFPSFSPFQVVRDLLASVGELKQDTMAVALKVRN